jgi:ribosomal protein S18 acetylase RimI-like enzyme
MLLEVGREIPGTRVSQSCPNMDDTTTNILFSTELTRLTVRWNGLYQYLLRQSDPGVSLDAANEVFSWMGSVKTLYPTEYWSLAWLGVSPKCQRTGIGKRLLQWGIDRSEEEQVPAVLVATEVGKPLYEKMGFREVSDVPSDKAGNHNPIMIRSVEKPKGMAEES